MASKRVQDVLKGIKNLTQAECKELAQELNSAAGTSPALESIVESTIIKSNTIRTAPVDSGGCACCGR